MKITKEDVGRKVSVHGGDAVGVIVEVRDERKFQFPAVVYFPDRSPGITAGPSKIATYALDGFYKAPGTGQTQARERTWPDLVGFVEDDDFYRSLLAGTTAR